jgi:membrane protein DedA with SNARE-associated domain
MWWQYLLVFFGALLVDITPFPLPPAFTVMVFLQAAFNLLIWPVIIVGVVGSALGRYILTLYIPGVSGKLLTQEKNEDIRFLGERIKTSGLKAQLFILLYTLLPLSSTPLFIAGGVARMKPYYMIPAFLAGKFTSDGIAVFMGNYAAENTTILLNGIVSWQSVIAVGLFLVFIFCLLFIDWRTLIQQHHLKLRFKIWN